MRCLPGNTGNDVTDCLFALTSTLERDERLEGVLLYGASYGGFIVGHMAAECPDEFVAMAMKNPLIDMATKGHYADNSDG